MLVLVFKPTQETSQRYEDRNQQVAEFDLKKQKKGHRFLIAAFVDILPRDADNCSHDPSLEKFSDLRRSFLKGAQN